MNRGKHFARVCGVGLMKEDAQRRGDRRAGLDEFIGWMMKPAEIKCRQLSKNHRLLFLCVTELTFGEYPDQWRRSHRATESTEQDRMSLLLW